MGRKAERPVSVAPKVRRSRTQCIRKETPAAPVRMHVFILCGDVQWMQEENAG